MGFNLKGLKRKLVYKFLKYYCNNIIEINKRKNCWKINSAMLF